jgi:hypothetical protein
MAGFRLHAEVLVRGQLAMRMSHLQLMKLQKCM